MNLAEFNLNINKLKSNLDELKYTYINIYYLFIIAKQNIKHKGWNFVSVLVYHYF